MIFKTHHIGYLHSIHMGVLVAFVLSEYSDVTIVTVTVAYTTVG